MVSHQKKSKYTEISVLMSSTSSKKKSNWFDELYVSKIHRMCKEAYDSEMDIVRWIFEDGELIVSINQIDEFLKERFNNRLKV